MTVSTRRARWGLIAGLLGLITAGLLMPRPTQLLAGLSDPRPAVLLGTVVAALVSVLTWSLAAWGVTIAAVGLAARCPSAVGRAARSLLRRIAPAIVRQTVGVALGVAVAVTVAAPSHAADTASYAISDGTSTGTELPVLSLDLDWSSAPPVTQQPARQAPESRHQEPPRPIASTPPPVHRTETVTVRRGDSLWALAAAELPLNATAQQIDAAWREWYRVNRAVIGADPNLLIPGQVLTIPSPRGAVAVQSAPGGAR